MAAAIMILSLGRCGAGDEGDPARSRRPEAFATGQALLRPDWSEWGLRPLPRAPLPPAGKPVRLAASGPVPVISRIPTTRKIVFITVDDGVEKDPQFLRLMEELRIPITMFLTDDAIDGDYSYFAALRKLGNHIQNHTVHHPALGTLPESRQRQEICGAQSVLRNRYGTPPLLFRPPYGSMNAATTAAVAACGPRAIVLWRAAMQIHDLRYRGPDRRLHPGDIILAHFRGPLELKGESMTEMFVALLRRIEAQGFAVARLEDYIGSPAAPVR